MIEWGHKYQNLKQKSHSHVKFPSPSLIVLYWKNYVATNRHIVLNKKFPTFVLESSHPKNTCQIFLPQKILESFKFQTPTKPSIITIT